MNIIRQWSQQSGHIWGPLSVRRVQSEEAFSGPIPDEMPIEVLCPPDWPGEVVDSALNFLMSSQSLADPAVIMAAPKKLRETVRQCETRDPAAPFDLPAAYDTMAAEIIATALHRGIIGTPRLATLAFDELRALFARRVIGFVQDTPGSARFSANAPDFVARLNARTADRARSSALAAGLAMFDGHLRGIREAAHAGTDFSGPGVLRQRIGQAMLAGVPADAIAECLARAKAGLPSPSLTRGGAALADAHRDACDPLDIFCPETLFAGAQQGIRADGAKIDQMLASLWEDGAGSVRFRTRGDAAECALALDLAACIDDDGRLNSEALGTAAKLAAFAAESGARTSPEKSTQGVVILTGFAAFIMRQGLAFAAPQARESAGNAVRLVRKAVEETVPGLFCAVRDPGLTCPVLACDSIGVQSQFPLIVAGPSGRRRASPSVEIALDAMGTSPGTRQAALDWALGSGSLRASPGIDLECLRARGLPTPILVALESAAAAAPDFSQLFGVVTLGNGPFQALELDPERADGRDFLLALGYGKETIDAAEAFVCGAGAFSDCAALPPAARRVFAAAERDEPGPSSIHDQLSLAAAISVALDGEVEVRLEFANDAAPSELRAALELAVRSGITRLRLRRRGAGAASSLLAARLEDAHDEARVTDRLISRKAPAPAFPEKIIERVVEREIERPIERRRLPDRRKGYIQKAAIGGHKVYLHTGEFDDGGLGEIFIDMHKEGAAFRSLMNNFAIAISIGLQYGVPLEEFVDAFVFTRFEPSGTVSGNDSIRQATSILDYIFRELAVSYLDRQDLANMDPQELHGDGLSRRPLLLPDDDPAETARRLISKGFSRGTLPDNIVRFKPREGDIRPKSGEARPDAGAEFSAASGPFGAFSGEPCSRCGHFTLASSGDGARCATCGFETRAAQSADPGA